MKERVLTALVCAGCAFSFAPNIRFAVPEGSSLEKTFVIGSRATITRMGMKLDGQKMPAPDVASKDVYTEQTRRVVVTDDYLKVGDGRPALLRRSYSELTGEKLDRMPVMSGGSPKKGDLDSKLEGQIVMFTWNEADEDYAASYAKEGGDEGLLEGLREDLDLRVFLPGEKVSVGDTWKIEADVLDQVFNLGGDLGMDESQDDWFQEGLAEILSGEIGVTYEGNDENEQLALLPIEADLTFDGTLEDPRSRQPMKLEGNVQIAGQLDWDLRSGHFRRVLLDVEMNMQMLFKGADPRGELEVEMVMDLTMKIEGRSERR